MRRKTPALALSVVLAGAPHAVAKGPSPAPPFRNQNPADWVGPPVTWEGLRGKVVLIDVWTFG